MAARLKTTGPLLGGLLFIAIGAVWFAHLSAWFMWGIVDTSSDLTLFLDFPAVLRPAVADLEARYHVSEQLPVNPAHVRRLAWQAAPDGGTIAVVPALGHGNEVRQALNQAGWTHRRLGGLIVGFRSPSIPASFPTRAIVRRAARQLIRHLGADGLPFHPLVLLRIPARPEIVPDGLYAYATWRRQQLSGAVRTSGTWPKAGVSFVENPLATSGLELTLAGRALAGLPADIINRWQAETWQKFVLTQSRPALARELARFDVVALSVDGGAVAVGARSPTQSFSQLAESWLSAEAGVRHPTTAAFRLPDGTLGYEKRPGPAPLDWRLAADGTCRTTTLADTTYWLCRAPEAGALARSEDGARRLLAQLASGTAWHVRAGPMLVEKLTALPVTAIEVVPVGDDQIIFRVDTAY